MLVLSRHVGQRIIIGTGPNKIVLSVERISGGRVRLGIEAPEAIKIMREELERHEPEAGAA